jgi:hypothetical protein
LQVQIDLSTAFVNIEIYGDNGYDYFWTDGSGPAARRFLSLAGQFRVGQSKKKQITLEEIVFLCYY